jgi:hypothetical protein
VGEARDVDDVTAIGVCEAAPPRAKGCSWSTRVLASFDVLHAPPPTDRSGLFGSDVVHDP